MNIVNADRRRLFLECIFWVFHTDCTHFARLLTFLVVSAGPFTGVLPSNRYDGEAMQPYTVLSLQSSASELSGPRTGPLGWNCCPVYSLDWAELMLNINFLKSFAQYLLSGVTVQVACCSGVDSWIPKCLHASTFYLGHHSVGGRNLFRCWTFSILLVCSFLACLVFTPYAGVLFACYRNHVI